MSKFVYKRRNKGSIFWDSKGSGTLTGELIRDALGQKREWSII